MSRLFNKSGWNVCLKRCQRDASSSTKNETFNIVRFYIIIPHDLELKVINYRINPYLENLHPWFKKEFVIEPEEFSLRNNSITLDSDFFLQAKDTAVGTIFVPTYATIAMGYV